MAPCVRPWCSVTQDGYRLFNTQYIKPTAYLGWLVFFISVPVLALLHKPQTQTRSFPVAAGVPPWRQLVNELT